MSKELNPTDLLVEVFRTNDKVNETSTGIRITHKPTGLQVIKTLNTLRESRVVALKELERNVNLFEEFKEIERDLLNDGPPETGND